MSFLVLSAWQAGALLLFAAAAIVTLYLLKPSPRRLIVSSTMLWSRAVRERRRRYDRWRWWISLLTALVIGLAIALAVGRPTLGTSGGPGKLAVVLDNGLTMASRSSDGRARWAHALERARSLLESGDESGEYLVVDTAGQIGPPAFEDRRTALRRLEEIRIASDRVTSVPPIDLEDAELHIISDGVCIDPSGVPEEAEVHSVFEPADNVGITRFAIEPVPGDPRVYEAFVEVTSASAESRRVSLELTVAGQPSLRRTIELDRGAVRGELFDLRGLRGGPVRVSAATAGDSLDIDNFAYGYLPAYPKRRVVLVSPGNPYLESALRQDPSVELIEMDPGEMADRPAADVTVFDRCAPEARPTRPYLLVDPPRTSWLPRAEGEEMRSRVGEWDREHALLEAVALEDLVVGRATRYDGSDVQVVAGEADAPLVLCGQSPVRWVLLSFSLQESNFVFQAGFPIFLSNALYWLASEPAALSRRLGTIWIPAADARVTTLAGEPVDSSSFGETTVFEAGEPGLYVVTRGKERLYVAVNPEVPDINVTRLPESDVSPSASRAGASWQVELFSVLIMLAFVLLIVEWWTFHRRWTV